VLEFYLDRVHDIVAKKDYKNLRLKGSKVKPKKPVPDEKSTIW